MEGSMAAGACLGEAHARGQGICGRHVKAQDVGNAAEIMTDPRDITRRKFLVSGISFLGGRGKEPGPKKDRHRVALVQGENG